MKKTILFTLALLASTHLMQAATAKEVESTIDAGNLGTTYPGISFSFRRENTNDIVSIKNTGVTKVKVGRSQPYVLSATYQGSNVMALRENTFQGGANIKLVVKKINSKTNNPIITYDYK